MKIQKPTIATNWLYKEESEDSRLFAREVALPDNVPMWSECTTQEKEQWEHDHPQPEAESEGDLEKGE